MKKTLWSYRIFVLIFIFTSYIFYFASIDTIMNGNILYWIEGVSREELKQSIERFSVNPIEFEQITNQYPQYMENYFSENDFAPGSVFDFTTNIANNLVYGSILIDQKSDKALLALNHYKYGNQEWNYFLWSRNFDKPLTVAKQFEENVLCNFSKIRTDRWRTIRGIYSTIFFDYQILLYIAFIVIDIIIKSIHKRLNRQK